MTRLTTAYTVLGLSLALILALSLTGCWGTPAEGPRVDARGNSGTVITNISDGSSSPIGTAPCGATSSQKAAENQPTGPDCSTVTPAPVIVTGGAP